MIIEPIVTFRQELIVPANYGTIGYMNADQKKKDFSERLNKALNNVGFPKKGAGRQIELANIFGVSQKGARKWLEGESIPKFTRLQEIALHFGLRVEWLASGEPPMYRPGGSKENLSTSHKDTSAYRKEEQVLLDKYRLLSPEDRTRLQAIIDALDSTMKAVTNEHCQQMDLNK